MLNKNSDCLTCLEFLSPKAVGQRIFLFFVPTIAARYACLIRRVFQIHHLSEEGGLIFIHQVPECIFWLERIHGSCQALLCLHVYLNVRCLKKLLSN
jgi:hypothetical protein